MKTIEYKVTYAEGDTDTITVTARDINSGVKKALAEALKGVSSTNPRWEFHSIEFWAVTS